MRVFCGALGTASDVGLCKRVILTNPFREKSVRRLSREVRAPLNEDEEEDADEVRHRPAQALLLQASEPRAPRRCSDSVTNTPGIAKNVLRSTDNTILNVGYQE